MAVVPSSLPVTQLGQPLGVPEGGARLLVEVVAGQGEQGLAGVVETWSESSTASTASVTSSWRWSLPRMPSSSS